jgi:hypothetical protein
MVGCVPMTYERIIFFDLETSNLYRVGQILNFCFVCLDAQWQELARLKGEIKLSRVELPDPGAIASTGIDVIALNERAPLTERQAMEAISRFFSQWTIKGKTALSGFNIEDFDIPYLRTNMLRSGVFPYDHPSSQDLMILVRTLFAYNDSLRDEYHQFLKDIDASESPRFSIRLEKVATFFGLLNRAQSHESEDDVEVTIALAKKIADDFGLNIFSYRPYQISDYHLFEGTPVRLQRPARSFQQPINQEDYVFLRVEGSASYWVTMEAYQAWEKLDSDTKKTRGFPIKRMKFCEEAIDPVHPQPAYTSDELRTAQAIHTTFKNFNINELYPPKICCVEQWIYRVPAQTMRLFCDSVQQQPPKKLAPFNDDLNELWRRYLLSVMSDDGIQKNIKTFTQYALDRYGPAPRMRLFDDNDRSVSKDTPRFHPSFGDLLTTLTKTRTEAALAQRSDAILDALARLEQYYQESQIRKVLA